MSVADTGDIFGRRSIFHGENSFVDEFTGSLKLKSIVK